jgi:hypothetical protein
MGEAFLWGIVGGSSVVIGGVVATVLVDHGVEQRLRA